MGLFFPFQCQNPLTRDTDGPHVRLLPGSPWQTGHIELHHVPVPLEEEVVPRADVARVVIELHGVAQPGHRQPGLRGLLGRVQAVRPHTLVQADRGIMLDDSTN